MDGKSARGSFDGLNKAIHLLSLVAHRSGLTLGQAEVPADVQASIPLPAVFLNDVAKARARSRRGG